MAITASTGDYASAIVVIYETLRAGGLLRGSRLNDRVELEAKWLRWAAGSSPVAGARVAIALQTLGAFERLHIETDRAKDTVIVRNDTEECLLERIASSLAGESEFDGQDLYDAIREAGGHMAVARKIREMGRQR
jgi:hypothetical protein